MTDIADPLAPAIAHREGGRFDEARAWLDARIAADPGDVEALALLTQVHLLRKDGGAAAQALAAAQAIDSARPAVRRNLARLLIAQGRGAEALDAAQAAWAAAPDHPENAHILAVCRTQHGQDTRVLTLLDQAIMARPGFAEALAQRALVNKRRGEIAIARADADAAFAIKPFLPQYGMLAASLRYDSGDLDGAIMAMSAAHALDPDHAGNRATLGEYFRQAGRPQDALPLLEGAVERAPNHAVAWANLGSTLQHLGREDEARAAYERALAIDPDIPQVANNLRLMTSEGAEGPSS